MEVTKYITHNPFRVLGVYVGEPEQKLLDNIAELKPMVARGLSFPFQTDGIEKFGPLNRTEAMVESAISTLGDPVQHELESLFWLHANANPLSAATSINHAVRMLAEGNVAEGIKAYAQAFRDSLPSVQTRRLFYARMAEILADHGYADPTSTLKSTFAPSEAQFIPEFEKDSSATLQTEADTTIAKPEKKRSYWVVFTITATLFLWLFFAIFSAAVASPELWFLLFMTTILQLCLDGIFGRYLEKDSKLLSAIQPFIKSFLIIDLSYFLLLFTGVQRYIMHAFDFFTVEETCKYGFGTIIILILLNLLAITYVTYSTKFTPSGQLINRNNLNRRVLRVCRTIVTVSFVLWFLIIK